MTFWGPERTPPEAGHHPHDAPPAMAWPLRILAIGALTVGAAVAVTHLFAHYFEHTPGFTPIEQHVFHIDLMVQSGMIALFGIAVAWFMYVKNPGAAGEGEPGRELSCTTCRRGSFSSTRSSRRSW